MPLPSRPPAAAATADSGSPPAGRPAGGPPPPARPRRTDLSAHTGWQAGGKANQKARWDRWAPAGDGSRSRGCGRGERLATSAQVARGGPGEWGSSRVWTAAGCRLLSAGLQLSAERERRVGTFPLGVSARPARRPQVLRCVPLWEANRWGTWGTGLSADQFKQLKSIKFPRNVSLNMLKPVKKKIISSLFVWNLKNVSQCWLCCQYNLKMSRVDLRYKVLVEDDGGKELMSQVFTAW